MLNVELVQVRELQNYHALPRECYSSQSTDCFAAHIIALTLLTRTMLNTKTQEPEIMSACGLISTKFYLEKVSIPTTLKSQTPSPALLLVLLRAEQAIEQRVSVRFEEHARRVRIL